MQHEDMGIRKRWTHNAVRLDSYCTASYPFLIDRGTYIVNPTATLSSKFQISIPKAIRAAQHWEAGLTFAFIPKGTGVLLVPVPRLETLKGIARGASPEGYRERSDRV